MWDDTQHSYGTSSFTKRKSSRNGPCSIASTGKYLVKQQLGEKSVEYFKYRTQKD
jgi:hypothetical protein